MTSSYLSVGAFGQLDGRDALSAQPVTSTPARAGRCGANAPQRPSGLPSSAGWSRALTDNEVCGQFHATGQRPPAFGALQQSLHR
jgi:hypothetical protein